MRARLSAGIVAVWTLLAAGACDNYSLEEQFTLAGVTTLTLESERAIIQQGESTELHPLGGRAPYELAITETDLNFLDPAGPGSLDNFTYTANDSIGTITVTVTDDTGASDYVRITILPVPPENFVADSNTGNKTTIELTWNSYPKQASIDGFRIERSMNGGEYTVITEPPLAVNATSHTDSGLTEGTPYEYRIYAYAGSYSSDLIYSGTVRSNQ